MKTNLVGMGDHVFIALSRILFIGWYQFLLKLINIKKLYDEKQKRYNGKFDGIRFGFVNGKERAFLIQNACPVIEKYIDSEYRIENNTRPVTIDGALASELNGIIRKVLRYYKDRGIKIVLSDLDTILSDLSKDTAN